MDYEKKYNEALKRAKKFYNELAACRTKQKVAAIFPELAESEDERTLRVISEAVITFFSDYANDFEDEDRDAALAWLEKQKEQDKCPEYCVRSHCIGCSIYEKQKEQKPVKVGENAYFNPNTDMWFIKKEQKPSELNEEFVERLMDCMCAAQQYRTGTISLDVVKGWAEELNELKKPAEWNDNDKAFIKDCARILDENGYAASSERLLSMFPVKQEWSEEDEKMLWNIISIVGQSKSIKADEMLDWLKSRRSSWKPSEEQQSGSSALKAEGTNE